MRTERFSPFHREVCIVSNGRIRRTDDIKERFSTFWLFRSEITQELPRCSKIPTRPKGRNLQKKIGRLEWRLEGAGSPIVSG